MIAIGVEPERHQHQRRLSARPRRRCCARRWSTSGADIGIALDGDADRLIVVDEKGEIVDGDQMMALIAHRLGAKPGGCKGGGVVATVMSNLGLERYLDGSGSSWCAPRSATATCSRRCARGGYNVGGEQSGHIILLDYATTGDGLVAALQVLAELVRSGKRRRASCCTVFEPVPQLLEERALHRRQAARATRGEGGDRRRRGRARRPGRLVIRKSGTEPVIRVMAEGDEPAQVERGGRPDLRGGAGGGGVTPSCFPSRLRRMGEGSGRAVRYCLDFTGQPLPNPSRNREEIWQKKEDPMLEMRPDCERCGTDLPADEAGAFICSFECTLCAECAKRPTTGCPN